MTVIGFIGLGRMGAGMAARLIAAGESLVVHDLSETAVATLVGQGAEEAYSPSAVGSTADIVFASLPSPAIVESSLVGDGGVIEGNRVRIVVDLSTSGPRTAVRLADELGKRHIASFDAPVSGGVKGAREGTLSLMVSGPGDSYEDVRPLLEHFGKPFYLGEVPGAGQTMKLVNNLLGAVAIAVTAEGMSMGIKAGLDPARMIEVLNQSSGRNAATQDKWPRAVLPRSFDFGFATGLSLKDTRLATEEARAMGIKLPMGEVLLRLLERTAAAYGEESDFTAMAKIVEADAGLDPERPA
jgi:3-hydroxyisobutyrate dehydrogenase-like beta-hydroxyacid dehydrogenase